MSFDGGLTDRREESRNGNGTGNGGVVSVSARQSYSDRRLRLNPNTDHKPESYDDLQLEFDPRVYSSLERHLPPSMLEVGRDAKVQFMREILDRYLPEGDRSRVRVQILIFFFNTLLLFDNSVTELGF